MFYALIVIFALATLLLLLSLRALAVTGVPVVRSPDDVVKRALDSIALQDGERFCEIGCAFGGVLIEARKRADVHAVGIEMNPALAIVASIRNLFDGKVRVRLGDARRADLRSFDAVFTFLMPHALAQMAPLFESQLREGARVASVDFPIPGRTATEEHQCGAGHALYFYVMGNHEEEPSADLEE